MSAVRTIAARELRSLFHTPLAWVVLALVEAVAAWVFLVRLDVFTRVEASLRTLPGAPGLTAVVVGPLVQTMALVMLLVTPVLSMRLVSEERRSGTLALLLAAPVSSSAIVLGKFLALYAFLLCTLMLVAVPPLYLLIGTPLDLGLLAAQFLGFALMLAAFGALGLYFSTLSATPAVAALGTVGTLMLLWMFDWTAPGQGDAGQATVLNWLSPVSHLQPLLRGVVDSADLAYYALFVLWCLAMSVRRLDALRTQH